MISNNAYFFGIWEISSEFNPPDSEIFWEDNGAASTFPQINTSRERYFVIQFFFLNI